VDEANVTRGQLVLACQAACRCTGFRSTYTNRNKHASNGSVLGLWRSQTQGRELCGIPSVLFRGRVFEVRVEEEV
jgi:hypothetical protein